MMNRTIGSLLVIAVAIAGLAACGKDAAQPAEGVAEPQILDVYNWPDYIAEDTIKNFEAKTGIKVNYTIYSNNDVLEQQLAATPDGFDVVFPSARPYAQQMISAGSFAALDKKTLGNLKHIDPAILADLAEIDPGNAHVIPYMWGTTGLGLNIGKVRAALGDGAALDSWGLLFDPGNAAKLSACGIGILDDDLEAFSAALLWKGQDPNQFDAASLETVRGIYARIRPHVRKYANSSELIAGLADGSLCLALTYSGDVPQAQAKAEEAATANKTDAPDIRYVIPREGALRWTDVVAIPKQAKHVGNAHRFIQYLMEPEVIADISNYVAYANANTSSTKLLDKAIAGNPGIYPPADVRAKLRTARQPTEAEAKQRKETWNSIVYGLM
jgi:putrescine transport system substrate-binding protein